MRCLAVLVAQQLGHRNSMKEVAGSTAGHGTITSPKSTQPSIPPGVSSSSLTGWG